MHKILIGRAFTEDEDSPFKKQSPIRSSILSGAQYIIEIQQNLRKRRYQKCAPKIRTNRPPIIELEFEKDILDPHIIIGGKNIQFRMKNERPNLCERFIQFGHPKKYCRNDRELGTNCAEHLQEGRMHDCRGNFCLYCKEPHKTGDKKICEEYKMVTEGENPTCQPQEEQQKVKKN